MCFLQSTEHPMGSLAAFFFFFSIKCSEPGISEAPALSRLVDELKITIKCVFQAQSQLLCSDLWQKWLKSRSQVYPEQCPNRECLWETNSLTDDICYFNHVIMDMAQESRCPCVLIFCKYWGLVKEVWLLLKKTKKKRNIAWVGSKAGGSLRGLILCCVCLYYKIVSILSPSPGRVMAILKPVLQFSSCV